MQKSLLIAIVLSANLFLIGCADDQARAQIADTNARLAQLQGNVGVIDNKVSNDKLIDVLNKLDSLQTQIDQLNGNVATATNTQKTYQATQDQLYQSIQQQIQDLQHATGQRVTPIQAASAPLANSQPASAPVSKVGGSNELKSALKKIKSHNFPAAINQLKTIISTSGDPAVVANASYYLTVSYAANSQYKEAIASGRKYAADYPQDKNAPDALRTVYISQNQLGMKQSAAKTAASLIKTYPASDAAKKVQAQQQSAK